MKVPAADQSSSSHLLQCAKNGEDQQVVAASTGTPKRTGKALKGAGPKFTFARAALPKRPERVKQVEFVE